MRTNPLHAGLIGDVQDGEPIQLYAVKVPRRSDLVSERDRESIEGEAVRLEGLCDWDDDLHRISLGGTNDTGI